MADLNNEGQYFEHQEIVDYLMQSDTENKEGKTEKPKVQRMS